jgi:hypothetical protein
LSGIIQREVERGRLFTSVGDGYYEAFGYECDENTYFAAEITVSKPHAKADNCTIIMVSIDQLAPEDIRQCVVERVTSADVVSEALYSTAVKDPDALEVYSKSNYGFYIFDNESSPRTEATFESFVRVVCDSEHTVPVPDDFVITYEGLCAYNEQYDRRILGEDVNPMLSDVNLHTYTTRPIAYMSAADAAMINAALQAIDR